MCSTDVVPDRLELAARFGATGAFTPSEDDKLRAAIHQATDGRGADCVIDMSGAVDAIEKSAGLLRIGGRLILVGSVFPGPQISISPEQFVQVLSHAVHV